jgi:hypothetical protein
MAAQMIHCGFCRRLTCERIETGPASRRQETGPLKDSPLLPNDALTGETYCRDCERFYHQLITFGRGDVRSADWNVPEPPVLKIRQAGITPGSPA